MAHWTEETEEQQETRLVEEEGEEAVVVLQDLAHSREGTILLEMERLAKQSARDEDHPIACDQAQNLAAIATEETATAAEEVQEDVGGSRTETAAVGSCSGSWLLWSTTMTILPVLTLRPHVAASSSPLNLEENNNNVSK